MKRNIFVITLCLSMAAGTSIAQGTSSVEKMAGWLVQPGDPEFVQDSLDAYIERGLKDWDIPGLALVIVKDGRVVKMKGYGVREIGLSDAVDENTLFMIASNTKLFTGTALALLDYRGKLSLDDKITAYLPDYRLYDSTATTMVTIRDMLSHRIGTKTFQGDLTFWNSKLTRKEIMHRMRYLKPVKPFRKDFGYCNSCFLTAGEVIPAVTSQPWEVFVYDSIIRPLQMDNTHTMSAGYEQRKNAALPYTSAFTGVLTRVPVDQWDNLGPAASIVSSVKDLSKWLLFQLDSGRLEGKQIMPFDVLKRTRDINTSGGFGGYGLGVFTRQYQGRRLYWHTGGAAGMVSNVCFVPEEKLGIAILTNNDNQNFFEALRMQLLDAYLGTAYKNRSAADLQSFQTDMKEQLEKIAAWKARIKGRKPELPLMAYTGEYSHPLYGTLSIKEDKQRLVIRFNSHTHLTARLDYLDNGEWLIRYNNMVYGIFTTQFVIAGNEVRSVSIKVNDYVEYDPYLFKKNVPAAKTAKLLPASTKRHDGTKHTSPKS